MFFSRKINRARRRRKTPDLSHRHRSEAARSRAGPGRSFLRPTTGTCPSVRLPSNNLQQAKSPPTGRVFDTEVEFDCSRDEYLKTAESFGGLDGLYCRYFDQQYAMIDTLKPSVVGHFDLVRLFDPNYKSRLMTPDIKQRIDRNLDLIQRHGLIVDCHLKGFGSPAGAHAESNPTGEILAAAIQRGIPMVSGDDSHGTQSVGRNYVKGVALLKELGVDLDWRKPAT